MPRAALFSLVLVLAATSCGGGGKLSEKSFRLEAESIQSLAAEGRLVAQGVAESRSTEIFARVHSQYLEKAAQKVEKKLASSSASGPLEAKRAKAERLAARVADELGQLHAAPGDRALADRLKLSFGRDADTAEQLAK